MVSIPDGQPQAFSRTPFTAARLAAYVSIPDGQPQAFSRQRTQTQGTRVPVSIPDGQPQAFSQTWCLMKAYADYCFNSRRTAPGI